MLYLLLAWYGNAGTRLFDAVGTINPYQLGLKDGQLIYSFNAEDEHIPELLAKLGALGIGYRDLETSKSSLEDIFVGLVEQEQAA